MAHQAKSAIVGLGLTEMGKVYGRTGSSLALEAIDLAIKDAGLKKEDVDGMLIANGITGSLNLNLPSMGGFSNLKLLNLMNAMGATPASMVQYATMAIQNGLASVVACVFADTPLVEGAGSGASMGRNRNAARSTLSGFASLDAYYGPTN